MKWPIPVFILVLTLALIAVPISSADSVNSIELGDITIMTVEGEITIDSREDHTINLNIYNANTQPVSIRLSYTSTKIELSMDSDIIVDSGKTSTVVVTVTPDNYLPEGTYDVHITVKSYVSDTEMEGTLPLTVHLTSVYSSNSYYNTVMGLFTLPEPYNIEILSLIATIVGWIITGVIAAIIAALVIAVIFNSKKAKDTIRASMIYIFILTMTFGIANVALVAGLSESVVASIDRIASLLTIVFGGMVIWTLYKAIVYHLLHKIDERSEVEGTSIIPMMNLLGKVVIVAVTVATLLSSLGVDLMGIVTGAGIASLGVSLGAKPIINEFFSGLVLLATRPFVKGDRVKVGNSSSALEVLEVNVMKTVMVTSFNKEVTTMPNSKLTSSVLTNVTRSTECYRNTVKFRVMFGSDIELAKKLITEAALEDPGVVRGHNEFHDPVVIVSETNEHGTVQLTLAYYALKYGDTWDCRGRMYEIVLRKFAENGIRIPPYQKRYNIISEEGKPNAT